MKKHHEKKPKKIRAISINKILSSAQDEFILQGYKGATVQAIADNAGMPKANVLYYFKNKENIYHAVLEQTLNMWDEGIGDILPEDGPKLAIEKFVKAKITMSFTYPKTSKIYALEIIQGAQHLQGLTRTYLNTWVQEKAKIFQCWIDNSQMQPVDPVNLIFLIWSSTQHYADFDNQILTIMNRDDYKEDDITHVTNFLTDFILRGCGLKQ
ncbi:TetR/AcrR family transcriptional regulator [Candidatus Colwellia aromaticivorans]|uniref:TetR/AcrR family transcriptional regulator n=1 Tax=Candidatus Colwellia aromaticivorans TaxID=2267621 RepID=UPI000DF48CAB|nr:TetR/AcrR family transcriptional regulator [Candidatus Colwellia aromaticivorans]